MTTEAEDIQTSRRAEPDQPSLTLARWLGWAVLALISFHTAQHTGIGWLQIPCAYALIELSRAATHRKVFYPMLGVGFLLYAPQLGFFWSIFGPAAIALWLVLAFWVALFGLILRLVRVRFGNGWMLLLAPVIWTGLEYFRSELYYLRFSWLTFGMANTNSVLQQPFAAFAFGFIVFAIAVVLQGARVAQRDLKNSTSLDVSESRELPLGGPLQLMALLLLGLTLLELLLPMNGHRGTAEKKVAGVQLEFPSEREVVTHLDKTRATFPQTELFMLSEYTFQSPPPQSIRDWCASNQVYLVVGGKEPLDDDKFYNMAYVIGTNGAIVHQQAKSVPIQFFKDGLPAPERKVWDSPWGKLGILTCYDLSYTRVVDDFVRQGAIALLNPTIDMEEWGEHQHQLHSRVAPIRAAEYHIPIFRVASSGISQIVSQSGRVLASAPYPGEGEIIGGQLPLNAKPQLPLGRWLAPACSGLTGLLMLVCLLPQRWFYKVASDRLNAPGQST